MTNESIIASYVQLLLMQYTGQSNVQSITFSGVPASGTFQITYGTLVSSALAYNATTSSIANAIQVMTGITNVSVTSTTNASGNQVLTVVFGVPAVPPCLIVGTISAMYTASLSPVTTVTSGNLLKAAMMIQALTKLNVMNQLPLQVQNAFNLIPTVQTITLSAAPTTGSFVINFSVTSSPAMNLTATAAINYSDPIQTIENKIQAILPSGNVEVTGAMLTTPSAITLTFSGVNPSILSITSNTLAVTATVTTNLAVGAQLNILGKYLGITRYGFNAAGPVTLSDSDFYQLMLLAIIKNNSGSSLYQIQQLLYNFFHGAILVYDSQNMQMSYLVNTTLLSSNLLSCFISQNLLPKPLGVQLASVVGWTSINVFFSFRTALLPSTGKGFNSATSTDSNSPWLSVADIIV